jgi:TetR/AcrR family transcriptional regulator, tetracycline repressor protein
MTYGRQYHTPMSRRVKLRRPRRRRGSLSREQVVEAALALADRDGLDALSMQGLASSLDCGVMTLYGYVQSKDELLDAIALRGLRDIDLSPSLPVEPKLLLISWGRALRDTFLQHPSLPTIFLSRSVIGPGIFRGLEALLGALTGSGISPSEGARAVYAVLIYSTGFVAWELPRSKAQPAAAYAAGWRREFANLPPADFPLVGGILDQLGEVAGESQFELGLDALASGLMDRGVTKGSH